MHKTILLVFSNETRISLLKACMWLYELLNVCRSSLSPCIWSYYAHLAPENIDKMVSVIIIPVYWHDNNFTNSCDGWAHNLDKDITDIEQTNNIIVYKFVVTKRNSFTPAKGQYSKFQLSKSFMLVILTFRYQFIWQNQIFKLMIILQVCSFHWFTGYTSDKQT